jgi:hypothetical protein
MPASNRQKYFTHHLPQTMPTLPVFMQTLQQLQRGELKGAVSLKLSEGLTHFPQEIFELADTLEQLDLSGNKLSALPADFGRLQKLRILFCSDNPFTVLPEVLADCPQLDIVGFKSNHITTVPPASLNSNLRWLILTNNKVDALPAQIGQCHRMQKLMLAGNLLTTLPQELSLCRNLSLLRISANRLTELPNWLLSMPKLSWLAFSGNPFSINPEAPDLPLINWDSLKVDDLLGEGASGIIYQAAWHQEGQSREVAVKVFKGAVTSDGLPEDELNASIIAGAHPGLVKLIGQVAAHPEHKKGLVMELIPRRFYNLGLPPSLQSCTRDVFKPQITLTATQVLQIAGTIASVAAQLHAKGIMHADLYAHNILIDQAGHTLLTDFGAACFYEKHDTKVAAALQRLEVSAYGYLLDDLLRICSEVNHPALAKLQQLKVMCLDVDVAARPGFDFLEKELAGLG